MEAFRFVDKGRNRGWLTIVCVFSSLALCVSVLCLSDGAVKLEKLPSQVQPQRTMGWLTLFMHIFTNTLATVLHPSTHLSSFSSAWEDVLCLLHPRPSHTLPKQSEVSPTFANTWNPETLRLCAAFVNIQMWRNPLIWCSGHSVGCICKEGHILQHTDSYSISINFAPAIFPVLVFNSPPTSLLLCMERGEPSASLNMQAAIFSEAWI